MVAKEFLRELDKTQETFRWEYMHDNRIRGFLKTDATRTEFDPVAAVSFQKTGQTEADKESIEMAAAMGLSEFDCAAILDASNGLLWKEVDGEIVLDGYCEWLRDGIALTVGLEPFEERKVTGAMRKASAGLDLVASPALEHQRS